MAARVVRTPEAILELAAGCDVVGVDEGQFLDDSLIDVCEELVARGVRVVIAGPGPRLPAAAVRADAAPAGDGGRGREAEGGLPLVRRGGGVHAAAGRRHAGARSAARRW